MIEKPPCQLLGDFYAGRGTIRLWNPLTGQLIKRLSGHAEAVHGAHSRFHVLFNLAPGALIGQPEPEFAAAFPGYRAEATVLVHDLFRMEPNVYTQFLYFTSVLTRYLKPMIDDQLQQWNACQCGAGQPSPDDWANALTLAL